MRLLLILLIFFLTCSCTVISKKRFVASNTFAAIAKENGFLYLEHQTNKINVPEIIKSGNLTKAKNVKKDLIKSYNYTPNQIFFDLSKRQEDLTIHSFVGSPLILSKYHDENAIKAFGINAIFGQFDYCIIMFSLDVLDYKPFHQTKSGHLQGRYNPERDFHSKDGLEEYSAFLKDGGYGEVVFVDDIPIEYIQQIYVHPVYREEIIKELKDNSIFEINGKSVEKVILSPDLQNYKYIPNDKFPSSLPEFFRQDYKWVAIPE